jgi:hypothetical protein
MSNIAFSCWIITAHDLHTISVTGKWALYVMNLNLQLNETKQINGHICMTSLVSENAALIKNVTAEQGNMYLQIQI